MVNLLQLEKEKMLDNLKTTIDRMPKERHLEILRKLMKYNNTITINSNRYGVYVNLSFLPDELIDELKSYVSFISEQERQLADMEQQKRSAQHDIEGDVLGIV